MNLVTSKAGAKLELFSTNLTPWVCTIKPFTVPMEQQVSDTNVEKQTS